MQKPLRALPFGATVLILTVAALSSGCSSDSPEPTAAEAAGTRFCLHGEFDLGARYQGMHAAPGEFSAASWCVITEDDSDRVQFFAEGRSNPDMAGEFTVNYLPPDVVRLVNRDSPPDLEFGGADIAAEARRYRRIDPRRLSEELDLHPEWIAEENGDDVTVIYPGSEVPTVLTMADDRLQQLKTSAELPLRGSVPVVWEWDWREAESPSVEVAVDGTPLFRAQAEWETLSEAEIEAAFALSDGAQAERIPGEAWPAETRMRMETLADDVYFVRGVRTGFHHLVVDTADGLVIGDAPAGWVELPQIPPADLVAGLGVSGLSERFIEFLAESLPGRPIRAVVLTHAHDDHAGGARAFAAVGAEVYAPAGVAEFLERALNRDSMPEDSLGDNLLTVIPVEKRIVLEDAERPVELVNLGAAPHVSASLGMLVPRQGYFFQSDLHVPVDDAPQPRDNRSVTECWFADWARANLDPDLVVLSSHGAARSPMSLLALYLDSDACHAA